MTYTETLLQGVEVGLGRALANWGLPESAPLQLLTTSENATYLARDPAGQRNLILRVHRPDYHRREEIESELAWIDALRDQSRVHTPAPVSTAAGDHVVTIEAAGQPLHVVAFEQVSGREPDVGADLPLWFEQLGQITARLHEHSRQWQRPAWFARKRWDLDSMIGRQGLWGDWHAAQGLSADEEALIEAAAEQIATTLATYGQGPERYGLVHADLRLANLLVDGERLSIIDYDDCGFCWFAYDFAAAISFFELDPLVPQLRRAWVRGYRQVAELDEESEAAIATFIMLRRIMLSAWLTSHADSSAARELDPQHSYIHGTATLARQYLQGRL